MDMGESSEAGTSSGASSATDYEVFLSFRGPDTRQGFTDCLYHAMREANIGVFLDEEELHVGKEIADELPAAIEKSTIYIPIFSKCYASSVWCLRELAHMVECRKSKPSEKEIMPIFYDVGSDDVKLKSQLYVGALDEHEKKYGRQTRAEWEDALKSVPKIKGWELEKQGHGKFIKSVIQEIVMKLKTKDKYVDEPLVGMDDQVEAVLKLLDVDSGGMRFVLIHGMGGIGKTTLAKVVFNKLNSLFSHCCFLGNVRESSSPSSGLVNLQNQLLSDTLGSAFRDKIKDVDDGIKLIVQRLSNTKVFIILDDVDDEEQLKKLAIKHVSFGSGSRVILTSRKRRIMEADQTLEYEVELLDSIQSLELFNRHAFGGNSPPVDYVSLSSQVVSTTGGLPLALEVIGSFLRLQNKAFWMDVLDNLKEIPHEKVQEKLKISYNGLSPEQKQIFLDIACLFVDEDKTNAFYMWKDCRFFPDYSIQVLVCMSLIKITDDNKFWMHDQLRDLGRKIVRGDTRLVDPREQSRLWVPETVNDIIRTEEKKKAIEAVCLGDETYTGKEFSRLPNIRFLKLFEGQLDGDFENQLKKLKYMSWEGCPPELSAINFHPSDLVVLNLSDSFITEDWAGWSQIKVGKKLKVLDLSYCCDMTRTPDFSGCLSLERLILEGCESLIEVDGSFKKLKRLIYFNARGCFDLEELPEGIGGLDKLEYLYLGYCCHLSKLPESFARLTSLVELDLSYTAITRLPDSIGNQSCLSVLKLEGANINELPNSIGNLRELKFLFLSVTEIKELPISIGNLESLLELDVSKTNCERLPESIGDLSSLKVIKISKSPMRELPQSIVALKELEELHAKDCKYLEWEIPEGIWKLSLLRVLDLEHAPVRNVPVTVKLLPCIEKLDLYCGNKLELFPELPTSSTSVSFGSDRLWGVAHLSSLTKLSELTYSDHDENYCPPFIEDGPCRQSLTFLPPSLSTLTLDYHRCKTSVSFGGNFRKLTRLHIVRCLWKEVQLDGLEQLIEFEVDGAKLLEGFAGLSSLKRLKLLRLRDCPNLTAIQGLGSVESLERLEICWCPEIESLDDLSDLKKLESLSIDRCCELVAVKGLDELETLKDLSFTDCRSLRSFHKGFNSKVPGQCFLTAHGCPKLAKNGFGGRVSQYEECKTSMSFGGNFRKLTRLHIVRCLWKEVQLDGLEQLIEFEVDGAELLEGFAGLSSLKRLKLLRLRDCPNLTAIQGLGSVESLERLEICYCPKMESLDDLSDLKKLEYLLIRGCRELVAVKGPDELETLKDLSFLGCESLRIFHKGFNSKVPGQCFVTIWGYPKLAKNGFGGRVSQYEECKTSMSFRDNFRKLTRLYIHECLWKEFQLDGLEQLIEFIVEEAKLLEGFAGLSSLKWLKLLRLGDCPNLTAIQGLGSVESLERLEICSCPKIESLDDLSDLKKLEYLSIYRCCELVAVKGLDELETLQRLSFIDCRSLRSIHNVFNSKVPDKCFLTARGCPKLAENGFGGRVSQYEEWRRKEEEDEGIFRLSLSFPPERGRKRRRHQEEKEDDTKKKEEEDELRLSLSFPPQRRHQEEKEDDTLNDV